MVEADNNKFWIKDKSFVPPNEVPILKSSFDKKGSLKLMNVSRYFVLYKRYIVYY